MKATYQTPTDQYILQSAYEPIHGYLAITICVLGTLFNIVNILVLTHKVTLLVSGSFPLASIYRPNIYFQDMRGNPINLLLTGIAVADMLVMMEYIPFATHMYLLKDTYTSLAEKVIERCIPYSGSVKQRDARKLG